MTVLSPSSAASVLAGRIPRVIHRLWLGPAEMPAEYEGYGRSWQVHHPDWEVRTWRDADLPRLVNQSLFDSATSWAQRADIARYEILLTQGGVYVDCDVECLRPIDPLLTDVVAFAGAEDADSICNAVLGAVPGHPFFADLVALLPAWVAARPGAQANEQTGPVLVTALHLERQSSGRPSLDVFEPAIFYPYHWSEEPPPGATWPGAFAVHHWRASWKDDAGRAALRRPRRAHVEIDLAAPSLGLVAVGAAVRADLAEIALSLAGVEAVADDLAEQVASLCTAMGAGPDDLARTVIYGCTEAAGLPVVARLLAAGTDERTVCDFTAALVPAPAADAAPAPVVPAPRPSSTAGGPPLPGGPALPVEAAPRSAYVGDGRILCGTTWGGKIYARAADLSITPDLVVHGVFDAPLTRYLQRTLRPGMTAYDVGANIGVFTVLMGSLVGRGGRVVAFEVSPEVLPFLRDNVAANYHNDQVTIREEAAWNSAGSLTFHVSERFQGNSSLHPHDAWYDGHFQVDSHREVTVDTRRLDSLGDTWVDLVKIDVEGAEREVLEGLSGALDAGRVGVVVLEVVKHRIPRWDAFCAHLRGLGAAGWRTSVIEPDGTTRALPVEDVLRIGWFDNIVLTRG